MNPNQFEPRLTNDGSLTLYSESFQESYHSLNGAVQESRHVFIKAGLMQLKKTKIQLLEVGFGTGLNALLTWDEALKHDLDVDYDCVEAYPLSDTLIEKLAYPLTNSLLPADAFDQLHRADWNTTVELGTASFRLTKRLQDFTHFQPVETYDLIYFDAFSPDKQPEMWTDERFEMLYKQMNPSGLLVTYCAKGEVRRSLQRAGFKTERLPGPPGKREMLRAKKS